MIVDEITPFVNSVYVVTDMGVDLIAFKDKVDEQLENKDIWYHRTNGMQTYDNRTGNSDEPYTQVFDKISKVVDDIRRQWAIPEELYLKSYTVNIDRKYGHSISHSHHHSIISGVFYAEVPMLSGNIVFERPDNQDLCFKGNDVNEYSYKTYSFAPQKNMAILFPSYMRHYVEMHNFQPHERRIAMAFDYGYKV
jgi:uncharacterized protein (TIGR02466 family)